MIVICFVLVLFFLNESTSLPTITTTTSREEEHLSTTLLQKIELPKVNSTIIDVNSTFIIRGKMLLVAVCSAPDHFEEREAIRQTWGKISLTSSIPRHTVLFFIGNIVKSNKTEQTDLESRIQNESEIKKDIVRLDSFIEAYSNLTRKTLAMIKWSVKQSFDVMLKVDDDTFVLLDKFFGDIIEYENERNLLYWGKFWGGEDRPVPRTIGSKFFVSRAEYSSDTFPDYADGPCYALGSDLMRYLDVHSDGLPIYSLEDAAVGIWLRKTPLNVLQIHGHGYMYQRNCTYGNDYYFVNPVTPHEMTIIMNHYSKHVDICSDNYNLEVCSSQRGCLCSPTSNPCWDVPETQYMTKN